VDSSTSSSTFVIEHPAFGEVRFVFDRRDAGSGFAATDGFIFFGVSYPRFVFWFERAGSKFVSSALNDRTSELINGRRRTMAEVAPPAFRSFVLSKARELAGRAREPA
jgi:hypothetical protein